MWLQSALGPQQFFWGAATSCSHIPEASRSSGVANVELASTPLILSGPPAFWGFSCPSFSFPVLGLWGLTQPTGRGQRRKSVQTVDQFSRWPWGKWGGRARGPILWHLASEKKYLACVSKLIHFSAPGKVTSASPWHPLWYYYFYFTDKETKLREVN